jgi:DNA repair/transcription protein MET18/MMS19
MKTFAQNVRFAVFKLIDSMMTRQRAGLYVIKAVGRWLSSILNAALKSMGARFVNGYAGLAEGEKDPRNLVISFAIVRVILIEFEVSSQIEVRYHFVRSRHRRH